MNVDRNVLRRDKFFTFAFVAGLICALVLTVCLAGLRWPSGAGWMQQRSTLGYWLTMLPAAIWVWSLTAYARWSIAFLPVVLIGTPITLAAVALTHSSAPGAQGYWITAAVMLLPALLGLYWCRRSPVWRK